MTARLLELAELAADSGPGSAGWATALERSASLPEDAARLRAVSAARAAAPHDGPCGDTCGCTTAEFRCCSFGSYTLILDGAGLRLEIRMPADAAGTLAVVIGLPAKAS